MNTAELMFPIMEAYEQGDLPIPAFCAANNLKIPTFSYWRKKFCDARAASAGFTEIKRTGRQPSDSSEVTSIELRYPNGVSIHLPAADLPLIARLIRLG